MFGVCKTQKRVFRIAIRAARSESGAPCFFFFSAFPNNFCVFFFNPFKCCLSCIRFLLIIVYYGRTVLLFYPYIITQLPVTVYHIRYGTCSMYACVFTFNVWHSTSVCICAVVSDHFINPQNIFWTVLINCLSIRTTYYASCKNKWPIVNSCRRKIYRCRKKSA